MRPVTHFVAAGLVLVFAANAAAQVPVSAASAEGLGLAGMTEARDGHASLWNPALVAIFDGPGSSWGSSLRGSTTDIFGFPSTLRDARSIFAATGPTLDDGRQSTLIALATGAAGPVVEARSAASLEWFAAHSEDLGLAVTTYVSGDYLLPTTALGFAAGDPDLHAFGPTTSDLQAAAAATSQTSMYTVGSVSRGRFVGREPWFGLTWIGATVKMAYVHEVTRARLAYADAVDLLGGSVPEDLTVTGAETGVAAQEITLRGVRLYSADIGLAANPLPPLFVSASLSNFVQISQVPADAAHRRVTSFAGRTAAGAVHVSTDTTTIAERSADQSWYLDAEATAQAAHLLPVLRFGASWEMPYLRLLAGIAVPTNDAPSLDRRDLDRMSVGAIFLASRYQPRASYTRRFDGSSVWAAAMTRQAHLCADRIDASLGLVRSASRPAGMSFGISWTRPGSSCTGRS